MLPHTVRPFRPTAAEGTTDQGNDSLHRLVTDGLYVGGVLWIIRTAAWLAILYHYNFPEPELSSSYDNMLKWMHEAGEASYTSCHGGPNGGISPSLNHLFWHISVNRISGLAVLAGILYPSTMHVPVEFVATAAALHLIWDAVLILHYGVFVLFSFFSSDTMESQCHPALQKSIAAFVLSLLLSATYAILFVLELVFMFQSWSQETGRTPAPRECIEKLKIVRRPKKNGTLKEDQCGICKEDFSKNRYREPMVETPCHHIFHKRCCAEWLIRARTCPLCRTDIPAALHIGTDPRLRNTSTRIADGHNIVISDSGRGDSLDISMRTVWTVTSEDSAADLEAMQSHGRRRQLHDDRPSPIDLALLDMAMGRYAQQQSEGSSSSAGETHSSVVPSGEERGHADEQEYQSIGRREDTRDRETAQQGAVLVMPHQDWLELLLMNEANEFSRRQQAVLTRSGWNSSTAFDPFLSETVAPVPLPPGSFSVEVADDGPGSDDESYEGSSQGEIPVSSLSAVPSRSSISTNQEQNENRETTMNDLAGLLQSENGGSSNHTAASDESKETNMEPASLDESRKCSAAQVHVENDHAETNDNKESKKRNLEQASLEESRKYSASQVPIQNGHTDTPDNKKSKKRNSEQANLEESRNCNASQVPIHCEHADVPGNKKPKRGQ